MLLFVYGKSHPLKSKTSSNFPTFYRYFRKHTSQGIVRLPIPLVMKNYLLRGSTTKPPYDRHELYR